jgi:hypothetical protein
MTASSIRGALSHERSIRISVRGAGRLRALFSGCVTAHDVVGAGICVGAGCHEGHRNCGNGKDAKAGIHFGLILSGSEYCDECQDHRGKDREDDDEGDFLGDDPVHGHDGCIKHNRMQAGSCVKHNKILANRRKKKAILVLDQGITLGEGRQSRASFGYADFLRENVPEGIVKVGLHRDVQRGPLADRLPKI